VKIENRTAVDNRIKSGCFLR